MLDRLWATITGGMGSWYQGKLFLERAIAVSHDTLHVIVGVLLLIVFALVLRRPISSPLPWLSLLVVTLWNEAVDLWAEQWPDAGLQYGELARDLILTMLLPSVLLFAARFRPDLFRGRRKRR